MRKRWSIVLSVLLVCTLLTGGTVFAFDDLKDVVGKDEIMALKQKGIISGITDSLFVPQGQLTYAQGVSLIVKGLDLNIDHVQFIKKPEASDYFTKVSDHAWYAKSFLFAQLNGLTLPKDVDPNQVLTREEFTNYLIEALNTTGNYPLIAIYIGINDEEEINKDYMGSIQTALITKIASLDNEQKFSPKRAITRGEAAVMLAKTIHFIEKHQENRVPEDDVSDNAGVSVDIIPVNTAVNQVVLTRKQAPSPGYGIHVERIEFRGNQALIYYSLSSPDPDKMYPQVITDVKTNTYVDAKYEVQIVENGLAGSTSASSHEGDPNQSTGIIHVETQTSENPAISK